MFLPPNVAVSAYAYQRGLPLLLPNRAGNAALPAFMAAYNVRFAKVAGNARDMHRPVASTDDLDTAFSWQEERTVSCSLTLQYEKVLFLVRPGGLTRSLARKRVTVHDFPDGRFETRHQGLALPYLVFDKGRQVQQGGVVANKNLGAAMTVIKAKQMRRGNMIAESLAALAPALGAPPPDRLGPVLAYVQTLQGRSEKKPGITARRQTALRSRAARASSDFSIGDYHSVIGLRGRRHLPSHQVTFPKVLSRSNLPRLAAITGARVAGRDSLRSLSRDPGILIVSQTADL